MAKAQTKAAKLRARRGRPKMQGVDREPNGRASRSGVEPIDKLALEVRSRQMGVAKDEAKDQRAGSFIGYLSMIGPRDGLSEAQYEGAQAYLKLRNAYLRAIKAPDAIYDGEGLQGLDDQDAYEDWCKRTIERYDDVRKTIQEAQNYSRENLWAVLQLVIIEDQRLHRMIGPTRLLCNILARYFKIMVDSRRAA